jgi:hypothetical protein
VVLSLCDIVHQCKSKYECEYWADISKAGVKFYKDATEKSLALAQKYLDSSGSKKQDFAEESAFKNPIKLAISGAISITTLFIICNINIR